MHPLWEIADYGDDDVCLTSYGDLMMRQAAGWAYVTDVDRDKRPRWLREAESRRLLTGGVVERYVAPGGSSIVRFFRIHEKGYLTVWWDVVRSEVA
jgi:hypothetical protein